MSVAWARATEALPTLYGGLIPQASRRRSTAWETLGRLSWTTAQVRLHPDSTTGPGIAEHPPRDGRTSSRLDYKTSVLCTSPKPGQLHGGRHQTQHMHCSGDTCSSGRRPSLTPPNPPLPKDTRNSCNQIPAVPGFRGGTETRSDRKMPAGYPIA